MPIKDRKQIVPVLALQSSNFITRASLPRNGTCGDIDNVYTDTVESYTETIDVPAEQV